MPIRMRRDEHQSEGAPKRNRGNTGGGGKSSGGGIIGFLLPLLFKNPLNINDLKSSINSTSGTFYDKIKTSLGNRYESNGTLQNGMIVFNYTAGNADAALCVIAVNKK
jgi:hypothetical protein